MFISSLKKFVILIDSENKRISQLGFIVSGYHYGFLPKIVDDVEEEFWEESDKTFERKSPSILMCVILPFFHA